MRRKAAELLAKEDFLKKFAQCDDPNAAIALFAQNGVTVTAEDLKALVTILKAAQDNDGEIPDEIAEQVAGGAVDIGAIFNKTFDTAGAINELLMSIKAPLARIFKAFGLNINLDGDTAKKTN